MNKLIITDEEIKLEESDELIEVTISDKLDIFDVTKIKILVKENTKLKIEHHIEKESKMDITFELEPDITLDTLDFKYGNNLKIQYHYYLKKNSKLNIIKFYDCNNIKELDLVNLNGENANIDYNLKTISKNKQNFDFINPCSADFSNHIKACSSFSSSSSSKSISTPSIYKHARLYCASFEPF